MTSSALLTTLLLLAQAPQPAADTARAVVLPLQLPATASSEVKAAAPGIERALTDRLARHAGFKVLSRADLQAALGKEAQAQLSGCDAESCLAEVADALGAELAVSSRLVVEPGLWSFSVSLLDRRAARALRRAGVKARSLDALMASLDQIARQLAQGSRISAEDPELVKRLGTTEAGTRLLRERLAGGDADLATEWTRIIVEHNQEGEVLAFLEGAAVLASGAQLLVGGFLHGFLMAQWLFASAEAGGPPPVASALVVLVPIPFLVGSLGALAFAGVLALVDMQDLGRLPVARHGCCRDEEVVRDAAEPGWGRKVAPFLAGLGGGFAASSVGASGLMFFSIFPVTLLMLTFGLSAPFRETAVRDDVTGTLQDIIVRGPFIIGCCFIPVVTLVSLASALGLALTSGRDLLDDEVEPAK
ncbi:MAG: hypothetical protein AB2A00_41630 [Myxococcota bacterium]